MDRKVPAMERDPDKAPPDTTREDVGTASFCWKEMLDRAFTGWEPADQTIERIIDRMENHR